MWLANLNWNMLVPGVVLTGPLFRMQADRTHVEFFLVKTAESLIPKSKYAQTFHRQGV